MDIRFAVESYKHDSLPVSSQRCVNAYAENQPKSAKSPVAVFGAPGLSLFSTIGRGPIRGMMEMNGVGYLVSGSEFYSFDTDGVAQLLGDGITGFAPISMDGNGFEIVIVNGAFGYSYLLSNGTFVQISDPDFIPSHTVTVINNIFAFDWPNTNKFFISNVLDGRSYDGLDFASAESSPDFVRAVKNRNGLLMVYGAKTIEPWDNTGASSFPFARLKGGTVDRGITASLALEVEDSSMFFLGEDLIFYRLNGLQLLRISTYAIEQAWEQYETTSDAFCFKVASRGHKFIYLTFPTEGATWGYDIATNLWHERVSWDPTGMEVRWRINCSVSVYNKTLVGDANSGKVGLLRHDVFTEFDDPIITTLISPPIYKAGMNISIPSFELDMETGRGTTTGQGSAPVAMMSYSIDGGYNYTAPEDWTAMGALGDRTTRLKWTRLGSGYQYAIKVSISDPVKRVITGARCPDLYAEA